MIVIFFLMSMFFDGIILPAFFGIRSGFLTIIFLVALVLCCRVNFRSLVTGIIFSGLAEFYWGLKLGTLMLSFLAIAGLFVLLNTFFSIKNKVLMIFSGAIMLAVFWEVSIFLNRIY